jgi:hypothetical protein
MALWFIYPSLESLQVLDPEVVEEQRVYSSCDNEVLGKRGLNQDQCHHNLEGQASP